MIIRPESVADDRQIAEVTRAAFSASELGHHGEAELIDLLRANCTDVISLIAEVESQVVGHILFSPISIDASEQKTGMGLGPMAVLPEFQRQGIGSALVESGVEKVQRRGYGCVVVLGHPEFYARFGFAPAKDHGLECEFEVPGDVFRVLTFDKVPPGIVRYRDEFREVG